VSGYPHKGTKYKIVTVDLLVPVNREMYMDVLSDFRGDNPDELVQWARVRTDVTGMNRDQAVEVWKKRHNETIDIKECE